MVWGAMWKGGRSDLVAMERGDSGGYNPESYQKALEKGLLPSYDDTRHFQQDNAAIHKSESTTTWLLEHAIELLPEWPPHSPDLNPIEHV